MMMLWFLPCEKGKFCHTPNTMCSGRISPIGLSSLPHHPLANASSPPHLLFHKFKWEKIIDTGRDSFRAGARNAWITRAVDTTICVVSQNPIWLLFCALTVNDGLISRLILYFNLSKKKNLKETQFDCHWIWKKGSVIQPKAMGLRGFSISEHIKMKKMIIVGALRTNPNWEIEPGENESPWWRCNLEISKVREQIANPSAIYPSAIF